MEGFSSEGVFESSSPITLVLVGRTGNGKSATGNSILGTKGFESRRSSSGVTSVSEMRKVVLPDGRILNVIDTPAGLFNPSIDSESVAKKIFSCIDMGTDGFHVVLVVFSVFYQFPDEEKAVISRLLTLFGTDAYNYMIIVFTGGDELENDDRTLDNFLFVCPEALKEIISFCEGRCVLFDNKTMDPTKKANQVQQLLFLVDAVLKKNGGQPYSDEKFSEAKKRTVELPQQSEKFQALNLTKELTELEVSLLQEKMRDAHFKQIIEMLLSKLEHLLEEERAARKKAEETTKAEQMKSEEEIEKLREMLGRVELTELQEKQRENQEPKPRKELLSEVIKRLELVGAESSPYLELE